MSLISEEKVILCKTIVAKNNLFVKGTNTQSALTAKSSDYFLYMERLSGNTSNIKNFRPSRGSAKLQFYVDKSNQVNLPISFEFSLHVFAESIGDCFVSLKKNDEHIKRVKIHLNKGDSREVKIKTEISSFDELDSIVIYLDAETALGKIGLQNAVAKIFTCEEYKTILNPIHLSKPISITDSLGILRTNSRYSNEILNHFNRLKKPFFIHFLDGDNWSKRDLWNQRGCSYIDKFDFMFSYEFFNLSIYKDAVFQWVDEFVIISPEDLTVHIEELLKNKDFTMTHLVKKVDNANINTLPILNKLMKDKKKVKKGITYRV